MGCSGVETSKEGPNTKPDPIENINQNLKENPIENNEDNKQNDINESVKKENNDIKPSIKESQRDYIEEENEGKEDKSYKKRTRQGLTILENVKEYLPETISREEMKAMVYNALGNNIARNNSEYVKGKNLTKDQVEGIIDLLLRTVTEEDNDDQKDLDDKRLKDVKVNIGFHDCNMENVRKFIFRGQNPSDEEVEKMLNQLSGGSENTKLLAVELLD